MHFDAPGVHPLEEEVHGLALAGSLDAGNEDDDRDRRRSQALLDLEELGSDARRHARVLLLAYPVADLGRLEHASSPWLL
jgi:hypothetical protein